MPIHVGIADDHPIVRSALQIELNYYPSFTVIGSASTGDEALQLSLNPDIDILILDVNMPGKTALEIVKAIKSRTAACKVVILTAHKDSETILDLLHAGVDGYILKEEEPKQIVDALHEVMNEKIWLSKPIVETIAFLYRGNIKRSEGKSLTKREQEVLRWLSTGITNKAIAVTLQISESTIEFHLRNIYRKMKVDGRVGAVVWAKEHGLA